MSSLSISTTEGDGALPSTSSISSSRSTTAAPTTRSYTSPSRRSPTTSVRSAQATMMRNGSMSHKIEEDIGTNKSGMITGLMALTKSSKKTFYAILSDRCFELHDNHKSYIKKKSARHIFDLATCFNVNQHEDAKLKSCVSIMTPDETFIFRAADDEKGTHNDRATMDWYNSMMIALENARALHLGRPVPRAEIFEFCWDVQLCSKPKIRKPVPNPDNFENICVKRPELKTRHRLGFYAHTIILCKMGIQPAMSGIPKSGIPPFKTEHFIEIQRQYVASFGFQEKYFIMRVGRAASTGMCEIWAQCESEEVAASIHTRLNEIIEREGKKRKSQSSSSSAHYHSSTTASTTPATAGGSMKDLPSSSAISEPSHSPKIEHLTPEQSATHHHHYHQQHHHPISTLPPKTTMSLTSSMQRPRITDKTYNIPEDETLSTHSSVGCYRPLGAKSIDQAILRDITRHEEKSIEDQPRSLTVGSQSPSSSSWLNMLRRGNREPRGSAGTPTSSLKRDDLRFSPTITVSSQQQQQRRSPKQSSFYPVVEWAKQRASLISGGSQPDDETEDSGGTLKVTDYDDPIPEKPSVYMNGYLPHEKLIELALEGKLRYDELGSRGSTSSYNDEEEVKAAKNQESESIRKRQITNDSGKGEDSDNDRYNRFTPEEQEDSSSLTADDAYSDDLSDRNHDNCEAYSTSSLGGTSSHTSGHHEKESNSSGSVSHLLVPSTTEQQHLEDIQSYISDSSDSCYSSLNANTYVQNPPRAFSFSSNLVQSERNTYEMMHPSKFASRIDEHKVFSGTEESLPLSNEGLQLGEEAATSATMPKAVVRISGNVTQIAPKEDLRKRAFSLGSRSWILNPLRKLSGNHARASSSKASSIADESENECNESVASHRSHPESTPTQKPVVPKMLSPHGRSDSIDSSASQKGPRYAKNSTNKKANDLMEVNFSPPNSMIQQYNAIGAAKHGSNSSMDSAQRSRAQSFISQKKDSIAIEKIDEGIPQPPTEMQMHEVQCFIKKDDELMLYALMKEKDTTSLYSTKTESSMPYFETIEENVSSPPSPRTSSRHSRKSQEPKSPTDAKNLKQIRKESVTRLQPPVESLNYVVIGTNPEKLPERKISVPSSRMMTPKDQPRLSMPQSRSENLKTSDSTSSTPTHK